MMLDRSKAKADVSETVVPQSSARSLLHNMSCRPQATIKHNGKNRCRPIAFSHRLVCGRSLGTPILWCRLLGLPARSTEAAEEKLKELLADEDVLRCFPSVTPVIENGGGERAAGVSNDPRILLGVLSRCSGRVFIRRKLPILPQIYNDNEFTLAFPRYWRMK